MSFQIQEALRVLRLTWDERLCRHAIERAWKKMIVKIHPDKNHGKEATEQTQKLNEAKNILLQRFMDPAEKRRRESEEETRAREKEKAAFEAKCREEMEQYQREFQEFCERVKKIRRERYARNRKKRPPGTRAHRKTAESIEGNTLLGEMERFFQERFQMCLGGKLGVSEISAMFMASRPMTDLESNLFKRHSKRIFKIVWPKAAYSMFNNRRCFLDVSAKE